MTTIKVQLRSDNNFLMWLIYAVQRHVATWVCLPLSPRLPCKVLSPIRQDKDRSNSRLSASGRLRQTQKALVTCHRGIGDITAD